MLKSCKSATLSQAQCPSRAVTGLLHPPRFRGVCLFLTDTLSFPVPPPPKDLQIVVCLWLITFCTKCSRRCWTRPLSFQCREIFKLCVPVTKRGLLCHFPLSCHKLTVKMSEDGAAGTDHHLKRKLRYGGASNPPVSLTFTFFTANGYNETY